MYHMTTTIMARMDTDTDVNAVIDYAQHVAAQMDAKLILFRSIYDPTLEHKDMYEMDEQERELEAQAIKKARNELLMVANALSEVDIEVDVSVNWKSPHHAAFSQLVNRIKPVLIVCGRSSSSPIKSDHPDAERELFELTDIPVLYVDRSPGQMPTNVIWAAVDPMASSTGGSYQNDLIIQRAQQLALAAEAELHVVHFHGSALNSAPDSHDRFSADPEEHSENQHTWALMKLAAQHQIEPSFAHTFPSVSDAIVPILADRKSPDVVVAGADLNGLASQFPAGTSARKLLNQIAGALCLVRVPRSARNKQYDSNIEASESNVGRG